RNERIERAVLPADCADRTRHYAVSHRSEIDRARGASHGVSRDHLRHVARGVSRGGAVRTRRRDVRPLAQGLELGHLCGGTVDRGSGARHPARLPRRVEDQPRLRGRERAHRAAGRDHRRARLPGAPRRAPRGRVAHVPRGIGPGSPAVASANASCTARSTACSTSGLGFPFWNWSLVAYTPLATTVAPRLANRGRIPWSTESEWAAPCPVTIGTPTLPIRQSCGSRSKNSLSRPLYVARYTGVPATMIRARVAASSARVTSGSVPRPSSGSAGSAARSSSWGVAPRAARRARACSTRRRDLDVPDGLPEIPTATRSVVNRSRCQDQVPRPISSAW